MERIVVEHRFGAGAIVRIGRHTLITDQPVHDGGWDLGPTPTQLFAASLAACVEYYAARFLGRHGLPTDGLRVECDFDMAHGSPARVSAMVLRVFPPPGLSDKRREALLAVVDHCTVHNSIREAPQVRIHVEEEPAAA